MTPVSVTRAPAPLHPPGGEPGQQPWRDLPLLKSKLQIPVPAGAALERPRMNEVLERCAQQPITLVVGVAGAGKTTALAHWAALRARTGRVAWVSLDSGDNDPDRFWTYVAAALGTESPFRVAVGSDEPVRGRIGGWIERSLERCPEQRLLILDDVHNVTSQDIHDQLDDLATHLPPGLRLILSSRSQPPSAVIPRLRVAGLVSQVEGRDLAFDAGELEQLLTREHGLDITPEDLAVLHSITEGWPAALALAANRLASGADSHDVVVRLATTSDRDLVDYLTAEVLSGLDDSTRTFLLRTSILDRLCAPLCEAVVGLDDGGAHLEKLADANLFVTPLGAGRQWFRYHHLFGEILRDELHDHESRETIAELHRRASRWFLDEGFPAEAVHHAVAGDDLASVIDVIASSPDFSCFFEGLFRSGRALVRAGRSVRELEGPEGHDPRVQLAAAWTMLTLADTVAARRWLDAATASPSEDADVIANIEICRCVLARLGGDLPTAAEAGRRGVEASPPSSSTYIPALAALGPSLYWIGEIEAARDLLRAAAPHLLPPRALAPLVTAWGHLALVEIAFDEPGLAEEHATSAIALATHYGLGDHFTLSAASLALGMLAARRGRDDVADRHLRRAERQARIVGEPALLIATLLERSGVARRGGNQDTADACGTEALVIAATGQHAASLQAVFDRYADPPCLTDPLRRLPEELTAREAAILRLLSSRLTQAEIGRELGISLNTVKTHVRAVYRKLGVRERREAVHLARERGLVP